MMRFGQVWLFLILALVLGPVGCGPEASTTDELGRVRVIELVYREMPGGARILQGKLENLSDSFIPVAQIDVTLFDQDNRRVESMMILVRDIGPGKSVAFREPVQSDSDIRGARPRAVFIP